MYNVLFFQNRVDAVNAELKMRRCLKLESPQRGLPKTTQPALSP